MANFIPIDDAAFEAARRPPAPPHRRAVSARFDKPSRRVIVKLANGDEFSLNPDDAYELTTASDAELSDVSIEGVGGTLAFPSLDAHISIEGLLDGVPWPAKRKPSATSVPDTDHSRPKRATVG